MIEVLMEIDPRLVRPGFTPLLILIGLFIALTLLYLSLRRQIRKIHLPYRDEVEEVEEPAHDDAIDPPAQPDQSEPDPSESDTEGKQS